MQNMFNLFCYDIAFQMRETLKFKSLLFSILAEMVQQLIRRPPM